MAKSPAHKLGQIIGDELEAVIRGPQQEMAEEFGLYLDYKHPRPVRDGKRKVAWRDSYGNIHDLDYVLEENGGEGHLGRPRAFIETAWRRYTGLEASMRMFSSPMLFAIYRLPEYTPRAAGALS